MIQFIPPTPLFAAFLVAAFVLAITPGPGVFYVVTRSLAQGRRSGLMSVAGVALGNLANMLSAAIGLAALFAASATAFQVVKFAGALYLIYLGVRMWCRSDGESTTMARAQHNHLFRDGFLVALLNPKTTLFYATFLPQFVSPERSPLGQTLVMGTVFVAIAACTDTVYAATAGAVAPRLRRSSTRDYGSKAAAGVFIGLGVLSALSGRRH